MFIFLAVTAMVAGIAVWEFICFLARHINVLWH